MAVTGQDAPWWRDAVVYQIYPRSFADSDGDGVGDLRGITARLDHLADLGADVLWLSPVYPSPQDDNGYDISDYQDIDPVFGTLADFDALLAGVHSRGMKLVMDLVVNHTSDEHPWFATSRLGPDSPMRDWYWWRPGRPGGGPPNNWGSAFGGSAWQYDDISGEYYLHLFSRKQPELNWENPKVRQAVHAVMRWWLDRGVDGFRMDVINYISKDVTLPDGVTFPGSVHNGAEPHFVSGPRVHEFLQEMHREVFAGRDAQLITVGETPGVTVADARLFTDPARREVDMVFQFEHMDLDAGADRWQTRRLDLRDLKRCLGKWQDGLADVGWNSLYWNNHDQPRVVSRFGDDGRHRVASATALGTLLHLHRGTPYIYQGEELGMTNAPFAGIEDFRDISALGNYAHAVEVEGRPADEVLAVLRARSRDNARTPMQWDATAHAGFTTGTPWIAVNPNHISINAAAARHDPASVYGYYRRLIATRRAEPALVHGDFTMLLPDDERVYAYLRRYAGTEVLVAVNVGGAPAPALVGPGWAGAEVLLANTGAPRFDGATLLLGPWQAVVLRRP
ncbi:alpha-glucosidase [Spirilliplanes yamanashiensis]|nr:alpha-glucosidase [Spirilliplanes yamanashiensis]MDP9819226.1 oligo-1,6-glucosidase [Spirilliplanes yamanashiensis]